MIKDDSVPSPLEVLARVNSALAAAGFDTPSSLREPLPLFKHLLQEWYYGYNISMVEKSDATIMGELLQHNSEIELKQALAAVFNETLALSSAHGTLTIWRRREIEQEHVRLQNIIDNQWLKYEQQG